MKKISSGTGFRGGFLWAAAALFLLAAGSPGAAAEKLYTLAELTEMSSVVARITVVSSEGTIEINAGNKQPVMYNRAKVTLLIKGQAPPEIKIRTAAIISNGKVRPPPGEIPWKPGADLVVFLKPHLEPAAIYNTVSQSRGVMEVKKTNEGSPVVVVPLSRPAYQGEAPYNLVKLDDLIRIIKKAEAKKAGQGK